ncbi:DegT/DnrJ/EryC1/StrS family aminotransferase [Rossellomorea vietnamensis]|uniref:DegT/DnrJ/EryC1/StrS family aminotransferase n=1 Tax=Rossellomorea vietnamensis TaxID=218284 RepID=UPI00077C5411|nr:DegT/DnrJ/EryC1/StrS family aminotransferase [Rossellomorea vietnamensis]
MIPMLDTKSDLKLYEEEIVKEVLEVIRGGEYIFGPKSKQLEKEISEYLGVKYALGLANGTDALILALKALGIKEGDEVITTPFTFFATAESIAHVGAKPVFVDIEEETFNMDPEEISKKVTNKTKAIIVVHLFGLSAKMDEIMKIAKENDLYVIEDACQALGTVYKGKKAGSIGDIGCFSFYPTKNLGACGDAGMLTTNSEEIKDKVIQLRNHGSEERYVHSSIGVNSRLDEIQAAILLVKLKHFEDMLDKRNFIAKTYYKGLNNNFHLTEHVQSREHTYHQYSFRVEKREEFMDYLKGKGISTMIYYPIPLHLQTAFNYLNHQKGDFPIAEKISDEIISLPIYPTLPFELQQSIIQSVNGFLTK